MKDVAQMTRGWGGSLYIPMTKFLKAIGVNQKDEQVFVTVTEDKKIIISKERLDENVAPRK